MHTRKRHKIGTLDDAQATAIAALALVATLRGAAGDPEGKLMQAELIFKVREMHSAWEIAHELLELLAQADPTGKVERHPDWPLRIHGDEDATAALSDVLNRLESCYESYKPNDQAQTPRGGHPNE